MLFLYCMCHEITQIKAKIMTTQCYAVANRTSNNAFINSVFSGWGYRKLLCF